MFWRFQLSAHCRWKVFHKGSLEQNDREPFPVMHKVPPKISQFVLAIYIQSGVLLTRTFPPVLASLPGSLLYSLTEKSIFFNKILKKYPHFHLHKTVKQRVVNLYNFLTLIFGGTSEKIKFINYCLKEYKSYNDKCRKQIDK